MYRLHLGDLHTNSGWAVFRAVAHGTARGAQFVQEIKTGHRLPLLLPVSNVEIGPPYDGGSAAGYSSPYNCQLWPDRVGWKIVQ